MNDDELRALLTDLAKQQTDDRAKTEEVVRRVSRQLGGLGNKFGSFTQERGI